jgi:hypothetical protein
MMATPTPVLHDLDRAATDEASEHGWTTLSEADASQGFKTGHMRWVLAVGFALAGVGLALVAILS